MRGQRRGRQAFGLGLEQVAVKYLAKVSAWTRLRSVDRWCCGAATMMTQSFCRWVSTSQDDYSVAVGSTCIRFSFCFSVLFCMSILPCHTLDLTDLCVFPVVPVILCVFVHHVADVATVVAMFA